LLLVTLVYTHAMAVMKKAGSIKIKWWAAVSRLAGLGMLCAMWISCSREPLFMQAPGHQEERLQTVSTGDLTFTVYPGAFHSLKFVVPPDHKDANLKGHFSVVTGGAEGIKAFLLNYEDYANWQRETRPTVITIAEACGKHVWTFRSLHGQQELTTWSLTTNLTPRHRRPSQPI
jgi:hypothetical protein